ncbi:MAG: metallophosphoesterase, partial [Nitriliruptorales bacterium]|nr:metallophosphoesterase [Nitriliruptorales bacterium]
AAADERVDALLCGGDLYEHERFSPDTAAFVRGVFADLHPLPVFLAPGNHDWYGPQSLYAQVDWTDNVHLFTADRMEPVPLADGLTLWGAAHRAPANTDGFLDAFTVDRGGVNLALFHGSERGGFLRQEEGKAPHAPFQASQIAESGLDHAFLGHHHRPTDALRHTYPGNPDPLTFGEDGDRGLVLATVAPDGSVHRERRRVGLTRIHDRHLDVTGCASQQEVRGRILRWSAGREGLGRVTLTGDLEPEVDLRPAELEREVAGGLDALLVRVGTLRTAYDLETLAAEPTVRGAFVRDVRAADLGEDERRRVLMTGLRALAGRDDLEVV